MANILCLFGCSWVLQEGSVVINRRTLFSWKCSRCGAKRATTTNLSAAIAA
jgi:hypothetical protein